MKKLFTLLTLALISIGSAWGADVLIKSVDFTGSAWADCRTAGKFTSTDGTIEGCTANADLVLTSSGEMNFNGSNMSTTGGNALVIPLTGINGSVKIKVTSSSSSVRFNYYVAEGEASCTNRIATSSGQTEINYTMTSTATTGTLYLGRRGSSDAVSITKIEVYTADASSVITNEITEVTINGTAISASELSSLLSTKALTVATAFSGIPVVKYTVTTKTDGAVSGTEDYPVTVTEDGDDYKGTITFSGNDYVITFTNVTIENVCNVTGTTKVYLTKDNITSKGYLTAATNNWQTGKTYAGISGDFYNMSESARYLTVKVKGAGFFQVFVQNSTAGRTYSVKVGDGSAETITHGGSGVESSGVFAIADPTAETTITIAGGGDSVYPVYIEFNPVVEITTPGAAYSTYVTTKALDFTGVSGLKAYVVTDANEKVVLKEVTTVPAGTPLVLGGTGTFEIPVIATVTAPATNLLKGSATEKYTVANNGDAYVLSDGKFHPANAGDIPAGKAYLLKANVTEPTSSHELAISFGDGDVTGIKNMKVGTEDNVYYDLQGRRVLYPTKGLYIVNGKKVILK